MKFLISLLTFNFLCVWCFGFEDCEGADLICETTAAVLPQLENAIPYADESTYLFKFEDNDEVFDVTAKREEWEADGQVCQDQVSAFLRGESFTRVFTVRIATDVFERNLLHFEFNFSTISVEERDQLIIVYDEAETASTDPPLTLRMITDTTLAGNNYQDVAVVTNEAASENGKISAFYYSRTDGLLRIERSNRAAFFRVE